MDWKLKLMQMLKCFGDMEGTTFDNHWSEYGITKEEQDLIDKEYEKYSKPVWEDES